MLKYILGLTLLIASCSPVKQTGTSTALNGDLKITAGDLATLTPAEQQQVYPHAEKYLPSNLVKSGGKTLPLQEALEDWKDFRFNFKDTARTIDQFMDQTKVVGLIIIKDGKIVFEQYRNGHSRKQRWLNFSIAKSVTSLLYGAALMEGKIKSLNDKVSFHIPDLRGSVYDSVSLLHLLQMSSGVEWNDDPRNPESDLLKIGKITQEQGWTGTVKYLATLKRKQAPGTKFNYNTVETIIAGMILKSATGSTLSNYLSEKIWKPFGMETDAYWVKAANIDIENAGCCISTTLRDQARLGLLALANSANADSKQLLPPGWMANSLTSSQAFKGYGYYWWLRPDGRYFASGAFGQQLDVDPSQNAIIAVQSYWPIAFSNYYIGYLDNFVEAAFNRLKN